MVHTLYLVEPDTIERRRLQSVLAAAEADTVAAFESIETFLARRTRWRRVLVASAALPSRSC